MIAHEAVRCAPASRRSNNSADRWAAAIALLLAATARRAEAITAAVPSEAPPAVPAPPPGGPHPPAAAGVPTAPAAVSAQGGKCAQGQSGLCQWTERVTIGPGLPALSVRLDKKIGFADRIAPIELGLNFFQAQYPDFSSVNYVSWWRIAVGITVTKDPNNSDVTFGGYVSPWGIQVDQFAFGVGLAYSATGEIQNTRQNWAFIIPFSYAFSFKKPTTP